MPCVPTALFGEAGRSVQLWQLFSLQGVHREQIWSMHTLTGKQLYELYLYASLAKLRRGFATKYTISILWGCTSSGAQGLVLNLQSALHVPAVLSYRLMLLCCAAGLCDAALAGPLGVVVILSQCPRPYVLMWRGTAVVR